MIDTNTSLDRKLAVSNKNKNMLRTYHKRGSTGSSKSKLYMKSISEHLRADPTQGRTDEPLRHRLIPDELEKIANGQYTLMEFSSPQLSIEQVQGPAST